MDLDMVSESESDLDFGSDSDVEGLDIPNSDMDMDFLDFDSDLEIEDPERGQERFHAIMSSDKFKAKIQVSNYESILLTEHSFTNCEGSLAEEEERPNPSASTIQKLCQYLAKSQEQLNTELEDFLNSIGFHNTYDAFAPHSSK